MASISIYTYYMLNPWIYQGKEFKLPPEATYKDLAGFVYLLTNKVNGKKYIGKKLFFSAKSKQVKGKKKKFKVESNWHPEYRGSINVDGKEYFIDLKIREGKRGKFFSAKVKRKDRPSGGKAVPAMPTSIPQLPELGADFVDDIPF